MTVAPAGVPLPGGVCPSPSGSGGGRRAHQGRGTIAGLAIEDPRGRDDQVCFGVLWHRLVRFGIREGDRARGLGIRLLMASERDRVVAGALARIYAGKGLIVGRVNADACEEASSPLLAALSS